MMSVECHSIPVYSFSQGDQPGFPFDESEESRLPRSSRLQRHLDELASRHPEFAEHLRPEMAFRTWGPRHRRGSGGSSGIFSSEDEASDARSQAGSEASGGAAPAGSDVEQPPQDPPGKLPQYGLRNTVDLGGAAQKLAQSERNQRSWSAPPDARGEQEQQPKRFVSRIEIQPKIPGAQAPPQQTSTAAPQASSPPDSGKPPVAPKSSGNVRHIPIFVEGRNEPVLAKDVTDNPKVPAGGSSAQASAHAEHFAGNPHFMDSAFAEHPFSDRFSRPQFSRGFHQSPFGPSTPPQQHGFRASHGFPGFHPQEQQQQPAQPHHPPPHQQQPSPPQKRPTASQAPPTKRPTDPPAQAAPPQAPPPPPANDPLAKVAAVQSNVDALYEQVSQFSGDSRSDKQYMLLDEMLTRNLIQLDDIETQGKEDIRQARKNTIRSIQRAISLLESKVPIKKTEGDCENECGESDAVMEESDATAQEPERPENALGAAEQAMDASTSEPAAAGQVSEQVQTTQVTETAVGPESNQTEQVPPS